MRNTTVMNLIFTVLLCLFSLSHTFKVRIVDESEDPKEISSIELEGLDAMNACKELNKKKEPEDENQSHEVDGAFDGDEILTEEQKEMIAEINDTESSNDTEDFELQDKRKLHALLSSRRWPLGVIPYAFNEGRRRFKMRFSRVYVNMAIRHWKEHTCLKFVNIQSQRNKYNALKRKIKHGHYISFGTGRGCSSMVGYAGLAAQPIVLQERGCIKSGTIVHEIGHAIGFFHEQSRQDRDKYISINFENVRRNRELNFKKMPTTNYAHYDQGSIMHYGRKYFGRIVNRRIRLTTLSSKDKNLNFLLGQRGSLSFYDVIAANNAYGCTDHCKQKGKDVCHNGGFVFKDCSCACPEGLTGTNCEEIELSWTSDGCAEIITLEEDGKKILSSPNYPQSYGYAKCLWFIKAPADRHLKVHLTLKEIPTNPRTHRCFHWLEVSYNLMGQTGPRFCGNEAQRDLPLSTDNMVMIKFDGSKRDYSGRGFKIAITVAEQAGQLSGVTYPSFYCKHGKPVTEDDGREKCQCLEGFSGDKCEIVEHAYCSFYKSLCIFENLPNNTFNWKPWTGHERFPDEMSGAESYVYISTWHVTGVSFASLQSSVITGGRHCMIFYYFNYDGRRGQITLHFLSENSVKLLQYSLPGAIDSFWTNEQIFITSVKPFKVIFEASVRSTGAYDIALHNFVIDKGACSKRTVTAIASLDVPKICKTGDLIFKCTFDKDQCGFRRTKKSSIFWRRARYSFYKPKKDHTSGKGRFMLESKFKKTRRDLTEILSNIITSCGKACLQFWYYHRNYRGYSLSVYMVTKNRRIRLHLNINSRSLSSGEWLKAKTNLLDKHSFKLAFVLRAYRSWGSFAIDDISIISGPCRK